MYKKPPPKTTPKRDERLQKLKDAICHLDQIQEGIHADEEFIRETLAILQYAESVLPELALQRARKSRYLALVHQQTWSRRHG